MKFYSPSLSQWNAEIWKNTYISGLEGVPWVGKIERQADTFSIQRSIDDSGRLSIVWPNGEFGACVQSTASLRCNEKDPAYLLPLELARGALHRLRFRSNEWQRMGLKIPESFVQGVNDATARFIDAVVEKDKDVNKACALSQQSIELASTASRLLCRAYINQVVQFRMQQEGKLSTLMGVRLDATEHWKTDATTVLKSMNTVTITPSLHVVESDSDRVDYELFEDQIRWAREEALRVVAGPLINFQADAIQNWMYLIQDFTTLQRTANEFVEKTVQRFRGKVNIWNVFTGLNGPNSLNLGDEQILQLAVSTIQTVRRVDPRTPVVVTMDMPWAEYLGQHQDAISPLHFADTLVRAELGLSGIALEMNLNYWPGGTLPRDLLDVSDLIDQWCNLGTPLIALLTTPSSTQESVADGSSATSISTSKSKLVSSWCGLDFPIEGNATAAPRSSSSQASYALEVYQMLMAKQSVHGIFWNQLSDRCRQPLPHAGLVDHHGRPKQLLDGIVQIRNRHGQ